MKKWLVLFQTEAVLYCRDVFGAFFTFAFPVLMLVLFGSIYGNAPTAYFDGLGSIDVSVPAYCAMILAVVGIMAFPLTLAQYKERKIYKRFDATPLGKGAVIAVQGAVSFSMAVLGFLLLFAVGFWAYGLRVAGNWALIAALLLLCMASIFALGFFFTAIAPTERICQLLCYIAYFLMLFLSGASLPQEMLPEAVRKVSLFLPLTHAVNVLRGAFRGAPWEEYQASVFVLCGVGLACALAGALLYRKKSWA